MAADQGGPYPEASRREPAAWMAPLVRPARCRKDSQPPPAALRAQQRTLRLVYEADTTLVSKSMADSKVKPIGLFLCLCRECQPGWASDQPRGPHRIRKREQRVGGGLASRVCQRARNSGHLLSLTSSTHAHLTLPSGRPGRDSTFPCRRDISVERRGLGVTLKRVASGTGFPC